MTTTSSTISKQNFYLGLLVALIIGFLAGVGFTVFKTGDEVATSTPSQQRSQTDVQNEAIATLEAEVAANPEDFQSWTRLGHLYFDTSQYQKAIAAYNKRFPAQRLGRFVDGSRCHVPARGAAAKSAGKLYQGADHGQFASAL
jgi:cytochrome c-type biogenesis protein CcmH/NrfG